MRGGSGAWLLGGTLLLVLLATGLSQSGRNCAEAAATTPPSNPQVPLDSLRTGPSEGDMVHTHKPFPKERDLQDGTESSSSDSENTMNAMGDVVESYDKRFTWVTYVDGEVYLKGARVLGRSLLKTNSKYSLLIIVPETMSSKILNVHDENIHFLIRHHIGQDVGLNVAFSRYAHCLNKIHIWTLDEYEKVCWLDSDLVVVKNIDAIFYQELRENEIAIASGCTCNSLKNPKLLTRPESCPFNDPINVYGNTGVFLTRPSVFIYNALLSRDYNHPFADQDAFNIYFGEKNGIITLDSKYNYLNHLPIAHPEFILARKAHPLSDHSELDIVEEDPFGDIAVFHFCYGKPWDANTLNLNHEFYRYWEVLADELDMNIEE